MGLANQKFYTYLVTLDYAALDPRFYEWVWEHLSRSTALLKDGVVRHVEKRTVRYGLSISAPSELSAIRQASKLVDSAIRSQGLSNTTRIPKAIQIVHYDVSWTLLNNKNHKSGYRVTIWLNGHQDRQGKWVYHNPPGGHVLIWDSAPRKRISAGSSVGVHTADHARTYITDLVRKQLVRSLVLKGIR